jgi:hypothetical protein
MNITFKSAAVAREIAVVALQRARDARRATYTNGMALRSVLQAADAVYEDADTSYEDAQTNFETVVRDMALTQQEIDARLCELGLPVYNADAEAT